MRKIFLPFIMLILISSLAGAAGAASLSFSPSSVTLAPGETRDVTVTLSDAPGGLAGYECVLAYPSSVATISSSSFPSWASTLNRGSAISTGYVISGVDLTKQVQSGATDITLATITLKGVSAGTGSVTVSSVTMSADDGSAMSPSTGTIGITVSGSAVTTAATTTAATTTTTSATTTETTTSATTSTTTSATTSVTTSATTGTSATAVITGIPTTIPLIRASASDISGFPVAGFTADRNWGGPTSKVQFYDRSSGSPSSWDWEFGDGGSSSAQSPAYTYNELGTYTVKLTVKNDAGASTVVGDAFITISNAPAPTVLPPTTVLAAATPQSAPAETAAMHTAAPATLVPATTKADPGLLPALAGLGAVALLAALVLKR